MKNVDMTKTGQYKILKIVYSELINQTLNSSPVSLSTTAFKF